MLLLTVSALALVQGGGGARAENPAEQRFLTEVLAGSDLPYDISPAYHLGTGPIADAGNAGIDPIVTGQIAPETGVAEQPSLLQPVPGEPINLHAASPPSPDAAETAAGHGEAAVPGEHASPAEGTPAWATSRSPMPFDIIRTVQFLQDQIARGNGRAIQVQAMLLRRFGPTLAEADPEVWKDGRNVRAAVLFVLSGGPPDILRRLMARGVVDPAQENLFKGALAYVENDLAGAERILAALDFAGMEPGLEAHLNLVLGQLKQLEKPKEAIRHLDRARLLAPGGLIEESALRMEVLLVDDLGEHDAADRLARQYFDRYSASSYSQNFEARFAAVFAQRGKTDAPAVIAAMQDVTARLPDANKRAIFLTVGRRALVEGNLDFAKGTVAAVLATADIPEPERQRANLYSVAATIGSAPSNEIAAGLAAIDRTQLHPEDVKLLDAATSVLGGIDTRPLLATTQQPGEGASQYAETSPVFDRAQQLLDAVNKDLGKAQP
jgi:chemotaxis protein MotC